MCSELMLHALAAFKDLSCKVKVQVVHKWIVNPDLHLSKFVKRRIDRGGQSAIRSAKRNFRNLRNCVSCVAL